MGMWVVDYWNVYSKWQQILPVLPPCRGAMLLYQDPIAGDSTLILKAAAAVAADS